MSTYEAIRLVIVIISVIDSHSSFVGRFPTLFSTPLSASREDSVSFSPVRQSLTQPEINLEGFCAWLHAGFKVDQPRHHVPHGSENLFSKSNKPALKEKSKHPRDQTSSD